MKQVGQESATFGCSCVRGSSSPSEDLLDQRILISEEVLGDGQPSIPTARPRGASKDMRLLDATTHDSSFGDCVPRGGGRADEAERGSSHPELRDGRKGLRQGLHGPLRGALRPGLEPSDRDEVAGQRVAEGSVASADSLGEVCGFGVVRGSRSATPATAFDRVDDSHRVCVAAINRETIVRRTGAAYVVVTPETPMASGCRCGTVPTETGFLRRRTAGRQCRRHQSDDGHLTRPRRGRGRFARAAPTLATVPLRCSGRAVWADAACPRRVGRCGAP